MIFILYYKSSKLRNEAISGSNEISKLFFEIFELIKFKKWNEARYLCAVFNEWPSPNIQTSGKTLYNYYGANSDAFYSTMCEFQRFVYNRKCNLGTCEYFQSKFKDSASFIF